MRELDKGGGTQYTLFYRTFDEVAYFRVPKSVGTALKESSYNKFLSSGSQNKPGWALLTVIFATLIIWRRLSVFLTKRCSLRQKNHRESMAMTCLVGLFTICTMKNKLTFGVSESTSS